MLDGKNDQNLSDGSWIMFPDLSNFYEATFSFL